MKRRALLRALAAAGLGASAGCLDGAGGLLDVDERDEATATGRPGPGDSGSEGYPSLAENGFPSTVCEESTQPWALLEIDDPEFAADWPRDVDERYGDDGELSEEAVVIGRVGPDGATPRAYPVSVLWYHEVVEDSHGGDPVVVTYCSLCRSGMVASRVVDGVERSFRATGLLWRPPDVYARAAEKDDRSFGATVDDVDLDVRVTGNLVLVDRESGSYWSQLLARAICGPLENTALEILPSSVTTWGEWRSAHEDTEVLLPPPHSGLDETGADRRD